MATILELAHHAGLSTETVLRVVLREPTNEDARRRVLDAIEALGPPDYPRPDSAIEVLPPEGADPTETPAAAATPAALPVPALPEAMHAELAQIGEFREACESLVAQLRGERRDRIEDLELVTDLLITSWRGVDRRLGRLEKVIGRIDEAQRESQDVRRTPNVIRFEPRSSTEPVREDTAKADDVDSPGANPGA